MVHLSTESTQTVTVLTVLGTLKLMVAVFEAFFAVLHDLGVIIRSTIETFLHQRIFPPG